MSNLNNRSPQLLLFSRPVMKKVFINRLSLKAFLRLLPKD